MVSDLASERGRPRNESVRTYIYFSICTCTALTLEQSIRKDVGDVLNGALPCSSFLLYLMGQCTRTIIHSFSIDRRLVIFSRSFS